ncbi:MAG: hypothetical protein V3V33_11905, partial [Candidatus Lokiarchaeia archaeon]
YYLRENSLTIKKIRELREPVDKYIKFNSIAISRLIAAFILIIVVLLTLLVFGAEVGHHNTNYGSAVALGGPSFFYVTGLPALGIGFGLIIYFILSPFRGNFSQSRNFYFFYELRPFCPWLTEVPKKDIEAIRYQNNHLGPKLGWIMLILPFIVYQLMTAIPLFMVERAGPDYVLSWTFLIISILEIIVLILLVMFQQNYFEIATKTHLYEMWFSPIKLKYRSELTEDLSNFFECDIKGDDANDNSQLLFSELDNTHFQLFNLIFGLFLIISGIVMATNMVLFGPLFWWVAIMYGFMILVKAYSFDFSKKGEDKFYYNKENLIFKFRRRFCKKFHYVSAHNVESIKIRKWFRKLDFFDIFGLGAMIVMLTIQQIEGWFIADTIPTIINNIISTIYMGIIFIFIILYVCLPIDVIEFKTPSLIYRIQISLKLKHKNLIQKYYNNLKGFFKEALKGDLIRTFRLRIGVILVLIIGSMFYSIYIIISFFV